MPRKLLKRVALYLRISKDAEKRGLGAARQEKEGRELADRLGWEITAVYMDNDISAYKKGKKRREYLRLLDDIRNGGVDGLIAWDPDRLHRQPRELEDFIDLVEDTDLQIATVVAGDYDLSTPAGRMQARVMGAFARRESEHKSDRLKSKHRELAEAGLPSGGCNGFGYYPRAAGETTWKTNPVEAAEIRWAVDGLFDGSLTQSMVAKKWKAEGLWPTCTPGKVTRMVVSARLAGVREHGGSFHPATWEAIIDIDELLRLRAIVAGRKTGKSPARKHLLAAMLTCGLCGETLQTHYMTRGDRKVRRYSCSTHTGCNKNGIIASHTEDVIKATVIERLRTVDMNAVHAAAVAGRDEALEATTQMAEHQARLAELSAMFAVGDLSKSEWESAKKAVEARMGSLHDVVATVPRAVLSAETVESKWDDMTLDEKRMVIDSVIETITITAASPSNGRFDPDRIKIHWR
jgi:DNA invertase Pin-like site-specific DNA recombinase